MEHPVVSVQIANDVIAQIAAIAAQNVEGLHGLCGGLVDGLTGVLGGKNGTRGVHLQVDGRDVAMDLYVSVEFGQRIPEVAERVQETVKRQVEQMTGLTVTLVNVHVQEVWLGDQASGSKER